MATDAEQRVIDAAAVLIQMLKEEGILDEIEIELSRECVAAAVRLSDTLRQLRWEAKAMSV